MFIDTHCHFDFPPFCHNYHESIARIKQAGLAGLIVPSIKADRFQTVLSLANQFTEIYAALGLHPIFQHNNHDLITLADILSQQPNKVVALGEIGLDRYDTTIEWQKQLHFFLSQLDLAKQCKLPVLIHSRRSHDAVYQALRKANLPAEGVIHGFSGSFQQAMQFVELGYYIGVGGTITYPRANKTRNTIGDLPLECLVLETDAPDMPLNGQQGQPNRPENIVLIFQELINLRSESPDLLMNQILTNTLTLFKCMNKLNGLIKK